MERLILHPRKEIFSRKPDFLKGRPKFPNGISKWKICVSFASFTSSRPFDLDCLCSCLPRKSLVLKGTSASPRKFPFKFDTSHLLQLSTSRFSRVNGKEPKFIKLAFLRENSLVITGAKNQVNLLNRPLRDSSLKSVL